MRQGINTRKLLSLCRLLVITTLFSVAFAAHSRKRVVVRRASGEPKYDRSITTFDPTGRLLQVEYGMQAADRGEPIVLLTVNNAVYVLIKTPVEAPSWSSTKVHRLDDHLWLFSAGLSGDARALASKLRSSCQQHRLSYAEPMTVKEAAQEAASLQHLLTRTGGARPLGCTAVVVGVDHVEEAGSCGEPSIFLTDPGGILEDCNFCSAGKGQGDITAALEKRYGEIRSTSSHSAVVSAFLDTVRSVEHTFSEEENSGYELWVIRPDADRRGKSRATCFLSIEKDEGLRDMARYFDEE